MKAEVFYYGGEAPTVVNRIAERLSRHLFEGIQVVSTAIESSRGDRQLMANMHHSAERYVRLLLAATPVHMGLRLHVSNLIVYGFYVYGSYFGRITRFEQHEFRKLFPAIAIQDRMVLVSEQLGHELTGGHQGGLFRAIDMGGVLQINFDDPEQLDAAILTVRDALRVEVVQAVRQYLSYRAGGSANADTAAEELGLDPGFVREALNELVGSSDSYKQVTCEFAPVGLALNRWTRVTITIRNESNVALDDLVVQVSGPVRIRPGRSVANVPANGTAQLDIAMFPEEPGDFPVEVTFVLPSDVLVSAWLPARHVWLSVA